jgi:hypothetical protein
VSSNVSPVAECGPQTEGEIGLRIRNAEREQKRPAGLMYLAFGHSRSGNSVLDVVTLALHCPPD